MKKFIILLALLTIVAALQPASNAHAATFNKNRLIDDSLFTDTNSMSVAQIQAFLESKGSLLANWRDNVTMRRPGDNCIVHHPTNKTAAEIIYEAANNWGAQVYDSNGCAIRGKYWSQPEYSGYALKTVSPKVLLVTLQKEQSLITANGTYSSNPDSYKKPACCSSNAYKLARAMGYGVPDSNPISEKYLGFYNQINWAAWQMRYNFERSAGNTAWDEVGYITYSGPMIKGNFRRCSSCSIQAFDGYYPIDGQSIYMDNRATASLYYYTPHTYPGYHGNYNFVQFYTDWFGSTSANAYSYSYDSQSNHPVMRQGFGNGVKIRFKNNGFESWYDQSGLPSAPAGTKPVYIRTDSPFNRESKFSSRWVSNSVPGTEFFRVFEADSLTLSANQNKVNPGQIAEFYIPFNSLPETNPKKYQEFFTLARSGPGGSRLKGISIWTRPNVLKSNYSAAFAGQQAPQPIFDDSSSNVFIRYKNTGNVDWFDSRSNPQEVYPISLVTFDPINRNSDLSRTWVSPNRPTGQQFTKVYEANGTTLSTNQDRVKPGQIAEFSFKLAATNKSTKKVYKESFKLARERAPNALFGPQSWLYASNNPGTFKAGYEGQSSHPTISKGASSAFTVRFKNNGTAKWYDTTSAPNKMPPVLLATANQLNRSSAFSSSWSGPNRPRTTFSKVFESNGSTLSSNQNVVLPGQIAEFSFNYSVPASQKSGIYKENFILIRSGAKKYSFDSGSQFWSYITVP